MQECCCICMEKAKYKLNCNHTVHKKCMKEYALNKAEELNKMGYPPKKYLACPLCIKETNFKIPIYKDITISSEIINELYKDIDNLLLENELKKIMPEWITKKELIEYISIIKMTVWLNKDLLLINMTRSKKGFKTGLIFKKQN